MIGSILMLSSLACALSRRRLGTGWVVGEAALRSHRSISDVLPAEFINSSVGQGLI